MNRRNFLKAVIVAGGAAPLSLCGPMAPASPGVLKLLPWQQTVLDRAASGQNVRVVAGLGSGKSFLANVVCIRLAHMNVRTREKGQVLEVIVNHRPYSSYWFMRVDAQNLRL